MKIALRTDGPIRVWHLRLAKQLGANGHELVVRKVGRTASPVGLRLLLAFERRVYDAASSLFEPAAVEEADDDDARPALLIEPAFDGEAGEKALLTALLRGSAPLVVVRAFIGGVWTDIAAGLPAIEEPGVLSRSLDQVLMRLVALIQQAVRNHDTGMAPQPTSPAWPSGIQMSAARFLVRAFTRKIARRLGVVRGRPEHWRIGIRRSDGTDRVDRKNLSLPAFTLMPDDPSRFRADPFLFEHEGRTWLFFEDFDYATRKGTIARGEIDAAGHCTEPRTVLKQAVHLSYPFVFAHEGAIYMLPEMSAADRIQLFRADPFPDRWIADLVLVDGIVASDATPVFHAGRYWLFATLSGDGGSSWDQLGLFHAPSILGPWTPHRGNPVLIDAGAARPAGAMWHEDGVLMRVAQDCRSGYGVGFAVCRVDRLDPDGFAQTVVARHGPPNGFGADGIHTFNRFGPIEVVDLRFPAADP